MDYAKYRDGKVVYAANTRGTDPADQDAFYVFVNRWLADRGLKLGEGVVSAARHALDVGDGYTHDFVLTAPLAEGDPDDVWVDHRQGANYFWQQRSST